MESQQGVALQIGGWVRC